MVEIVFLFLKNGNALSVELSSSPRRCFKQSLSQCAYYDRFNIFSAYNETDTFCGKDALKLHFPIVRLEVRFRNSFPSK